jgi:hypothetical protein
MLNKEPRLNDSKDDLSSQAAAIHKSSENWWQSKLALRVVFFVLLVGTIGLLTWSFMFRPYVSTDDARIAMTLVRLAPSGTSGRIEKVNVTEGSIVKSGDILLEIDHRIAKANFERVHLTEWLYSDLPRSVIYLNRIKRPSLLPIKQMHGLLPTSKRHLSEQLRLVSRFK